MATTPSAGDAPSEHPMLHAMAKNWWLILARAPRATVTSCAASVRVTSQRRARLRQS
jgi:hypothetical protein